MLALYKNIKARRLELKMSQDRLAELTGGPPYSVEQLSVQDWLPDQV